MARRHRIAAAESGIRVRSGWAEELDDAADVGVDSGTVGEEAVQSGLAEIDVLGELRGAFGLAANPARSEHASTPD